MDYIVANSPTNISNTISWGKRGLYSWPTIPRWVLKFLDQYKLD